MPALPLACLAYVAGIAAAAFLGGPWWLTVLAATVVAGGTPLVEPALASRLALIAAVAFAGVGHARFIAAHSNADPVLVGRSGTHQVVGVITDDARVVGTTARFVIDVESVDNKPAHGAISVTVRAPIPPAPVVQAGQRVELTGSIDAARSQAADVSMTYPERWKVTEADTSSEFIRALRDVKQWTRANIERSLPEPAAGLAAGVLLGAQGTMPGELTTALRQTGTTHLIVASGQNIALVTGTVVVVLSYIMPRRRAGLVALAMLPVYVILVGAGAPIVRGAIMAAAIALAAAGGRRTPAWIFLLYAVAVMLALDPGLMLRVSFQLSAAATAGVLLIAPPVGDAIRAFFGAQRGGSMVATLLEASAVSLSAAIAVLPVQAATFGSMSMVQVPANVVVAPLYGGTVFVAAVTAVFGWLPAFVAVSQVVATLIPETFIALIEGMAALPLATVEIHAPVAAGIVWYAAVAAAVWALYRRRPTGLNLGAEGISIPVALAVIAGGLWIAALAPRESLPSVTVLNVGQGLAVLIRDGDSSMLFDAGPPDGAVLAALHRAGDRGRLDVIVISHGDADHIGGLDGLVRRVGAEHVLAGREVRPGDGLIERIDIGDRIHVGARTTVDVLGPPVVTSPTSMDSNNDRALVLMVTIGERRILLPADIEAASEHWLATSGEDLRADAIVVPHHGSKTSSTPEFLAAVNPQVAVISVGARNSYGHPASEVLVRYADRTLYRTDLHGDVTLRSNGTRLWVAPAKQPVSTTRTPPSRGRP